MATHTSPETRRNETVAFRTTADVKRLVQAAAARRGVFASDVLRRAVFDHLREEFGPAAVPEGDER